mmetsp:Transcript_22164/g.77685  ORF Transcript_22164/g.77685 Transcript_22164/m.77685 type:complete len:203 (+) Transcript_22164:2379-2987(+)
MALPASFTASAVVFARTRRRCIVPISVLLRALAFCTSASALSASDLSGSSRACSSSTAAAVSSTAFWMGSFSAFLSKNSCHGRHFSYSSFLRMLSSRSRISSACFFVAATSAASASACVRRCPTLESVLATFSLSAMTSLCMVKRKPEPMPVSVMCRISSGVICVNEPTASCCRNCDLLDTWMLMRAISLRSPLCVVALPLT